MEYTITLSDKDMCNVLHALSDHEHHYRYQEREGGTTSEHWALRRKQVQDTANEIYRQIQNRDGQ